MVLQNISHSFFFNSEAYVDYQLAQQPTVQVTLFEATEAYSQLRCHIFYDSQKAFNPLRGTFGGIEVIGRFCTHLVKVLLLELQAWATQQGIESVQIAMYPDKYAPELVAALHEMVLQHGFEVLYEDQTAIIEINATDLKEKMHRGERHKLNKAQKAGFFCEQLADYTLPWVYSLLVAAREAKQYPITLTQTQLADLLQQFPQHYRLFGVWTPQSELIAGAVCVQVHPEVLYTFYIGDLPSYRAYSPVVLLHEGIYQYCQQNSISLLDLGIGTEKGVLNRPLLEFKQHLGGEISPKRTYVWKP